MKQCPACKREFEDKMLFCAYDAHPLEIKGLLDGKYKLEEMIGRGGMGQVYRATHIHINAVFAVKILNPMLVANEQSVERFRREAEAAAQLRHPNAISVTDFGVSKECGTVYFVMELLEGVCLRKKLLEDKQLDHIKIYNIVHQICAALQAAHSKGIIHRDLKPDNIFLIRPFDIEQIKVLNFIKSQDMELVKVLDFGLAKLKSYGDNNDSITPEGKILGTPHYMSPEQIMGGDHDLRLDIYSLGVIIYEMITGQRPFESSTPPGICVKHISEKPRPMRELRPDTPPDVDKLVMRALEKDRKDRQASVIELIEEYQQALRNAGIKLPAASNEEKPALRSRSRVMENIWKKLENKSDGEKTPSSNSAGEQAQINSEQHSSPLKTIPPEKAKTVDNSNVPTISVDVDDIFGSQQLSFSDSGSGSKKKH
jgi:serine/threonine-protein kinase